MQTNLDPEKIELMDRYLDHQLKGRELHAFERELANDPELVRELKDYNRFRKSLRSFAGVDEWDYFYLADPKERAVPVKKRSNFFKALLVSLTGVFIALACFLAYTVAFVKPGNLFKKQYRHLQPSTMYLQSELSTDYFAGDFRKVAAAYERETTRSATDRLLAANAYLMLHKPGQAVSVLENQAGEESEYYLAMAYLRNGDLDKALALFRKIRSERSHSHYADVNRWFLLQVELQARFR